MRTGNRARRVLPAAVVVIGSLAAGCGGGQNTGASSDPAGPTTAAAASKAETPTGGGGGGSGSKDVCELLTEAEVGQVVGLPVSKRKDAKVGAQICDYTPTDRAEKLRVHVMTTPPKGILWESLTKAKPAPEVADGAESGETMDGQLVRFQRNGQGTIVLTERAGMPKTVAIAKLVASRSG